MHWILQYNLYREEGLVALIEGLRRLDIPYTLVKAVPMSDDAPEGEQIYLYDETTDNVPFVNPPDGPVMVCGSTTLANIAAKRKWYPGSFLNSNHDYRVWKEHYGEHLLNVDAVVSRLDSVERRVGPFFIRPCEDSKTFSGKVVDDWEDFVAWRDRVLSISDHYTTLTPDAMVACSSPKIIFTETRFFVVDGEIVGQSVYKRGKRVIYDAMVDDEAVAYAKEMIALWQPARAFVIDIAWTDEGYRIVEINCINSAGFYAIDVLKFISAIENMDLS